MAIGGVLLHATITHKNILADRKIIYCTIWLLKSSECASCGNIVSVLFFFRVCASVRVNLSTLLFLSFIFPSCLLLCCCVVAVCCRSFLRPDVIHVMPYIYYYNWPSVHLSRNFNFCCMFLIYFFRLSVDLLVRSLPLAFLKLSVALCRSLSLHFIHLECALSLTRHAFNVKHIPPTHTELE